MIVGVIFGGLGVDVGAELEVGVTFSIGLSILLQAVNTKIANRNNTRIFIMFCF